MLVSPSLVMKLAKVEPRNSNTYGGLEIGSGFSEQEFCGQYRLKGVTDIRGIRIWNGRF